MADVQKDAPVKLDPAIVRAVTRDAELRSLRPGSAEYQAAFTKKFGDKTDTPTKTESTAVTEEPKTEAKTEATENTETSTTDDETAGLKAKAKRRFESLSVEKKALSEENKSLKARIAELERTGVTPKAAEKQATAEQKQESNSEKFDKPKPKASDFKGANALEDFTEAMGEWSAEKRDFEREQKAKAKSVEDSYQARVNKFFEEGKKLALEKGLEEEDFKALVTDDGIKAYGSTREAVMESPFGAHIALELANSDDATKERISKMTPVQQVAYIGKIEAKYEALEEGKKTGGSAKISGAKAPGKSLQKGTASTKAYHPGMDFKSYEAMRKEQRPEKFKR
jgi:hypothetical protein